MTFRISDPVAFARGQSEYWRRVNESEGFDLEGITAPQGTVGLRPYVCDNKFGFRHPYLADLYAKVGLHRYNMLEGTNLQLARVIKFNELGNCLTAYYITLVASDPVTGSNLDFQVRVDERLPNRLALVVSVARPKGISGSSTTLPSPGTFTEEPFRFERDGGLPEWPSLDAFAINDGRRFYVMNESELRDADWIRLYLELQVCKFDRGAERFLSELKILKVAIETTTEDVEPLKAKSVIVYITFKGVAIRGMSEHAERKLIVRRAISQQTGFMSLLGGFSGEEDKYSKMTTLEAFEFFQNFVRGLAASNVD